MTTTPPESTSLAKNKNDGDLATSFRKDRERPLKTIKRSIWSSIRLKATLAAIAIGTLPVIAVGGIAYHFANQSITQRIANEQEAKAVELADKLNRFMFERYGDIQTLAKQPELANPKIRAITSLQEKQAALDSFFEAHAGTYDSIALYNVADGNLIVKSTKGEAAPNNASRDYFQAVLKTDKAVFSKLQISKITGIFSIFTAAPVKDSVTGKTIAIVRARLTIASLEEIAQNFGRAGDEYHLVDPSGKFFVSIEKLKVGKEVKAYYYGLDKPQEIRQASALVTSEKNGTAQKLIGYAPVPKFANIPQLNWSVLLGIDTEVAFKPQQELLLTLAVGTGVAALLVGVLAAWIANRATRPIQEATDAVEKVGQGELDIRIQTQGNDELAILGTNINQMAEQIQTLLDNAQKSAAEIEQQKEAVVQESEVLQTDVGHILDVVSAVEDGDLTVQADVNDRATGLVSDTLNRLIEQLGQVLSQVQVTTQQVSARSADLEELAKTVAGNAASQAQEAQRALALTNQVQDSARSSAEEVNVANQSLLNMRSAVEQGQGELNTMNQGINDLQQGTDRIVQQMKALGEFVGLAEQFVQDQSQIASLTQVLALNATLVAARASEQKDPRKFVVVAREFEAIATQVGNLAQQTNSGLEALQQRTSQINAVVSGVDAEVQGLGSLVNGFTKGVAQSSQIFSNVQTIAGDAVQAGTAVTKSNQEIIAAAQATAQAMRDIAVLADRTARLTQTTREQSEQMGNLSDQLLKNVQFFRLPESMLQDKEAIQRVDLSQDPEDTVLIEPSKASASIGLVNASESVLSRSL